MIPNISPLTISRFIPLSASTLPSLPAKVLLTFSTRIIVFFSFAFTSAWFLSSILLCSSKLIIIPLLSYDKYLIMTLASIYHIRLNASKCGFMIVYLFGMITMNCSILPLSGHVKSFSNFLYSFFISPDIGNS